MRILDVNGNEVLQPNDFLGYVVKENLFVAHHGAVEAVEEVGQYEVVAEYPNGGKDVEWIVDVEAVEAVEAWDEYEEILRYIEYTEEELANRVETPTQLDRLEAQLTYTAMMTDTLLEV
jgi:hypothetical protein